jgi:hypothetical protein
LSSCVMETGLVLAQLRDVLATENSPIMTKESKNRRSLLPKRAESYLVSTCIGQDDRGQCLSKGKCHDREAHYK